MTTRKKNAVTTRLKKSRVAEPPQRVPVAIDIEALLSIGEERIVIDDEENDNASFMAELIDPI